MEVTEKKMVGGQLQEKVATKDIKSTLDGKVLAIKAKPGDAVKKGKDVLMVLEPEKGQLP
jgi:biotin carboxyl carrier protein